MKLTIILALLALLISLIPVWTIHFVIPERSTHGTVSTEKTIQVNTWKKIQHLRGKLLF